MKLKLLLTSLFIFNINASDIDLSTVRYQLSVPSNTSGLSKIVNVPYLKLNESTASEVFFNNGSRAFLNRNDRLFRVDNIDSVILNNGELLGVESIREELKYEGQVNIGNIKGQIFSVSAPTQGGGG